MEPLSAARRPRSIIKINGAKIPGLKGWTWDGNTLFQADTFSASFALFGLGAANDAAWFASQSSLDVEILQGWPAEAANFSESDLESIFQGRVDEPVLDWERGLLSLTGRDRTADLIDNKTSDKFPNKTSSEIATILARRHGLKPVVTATKRLVGAFYKDTHTRLEDDRTEWDLLTWLAREEGFITYVAGQELHFEPHGSTAQPYKLTWTPSASGGPPSLNGSTLQTSRSLTIAKDIEVTVRSWTPKRKKAVVVKATRQKKGGGKVQKYSYVIPGLSPAQAQQRANAILADLSRHEMKLRLTGPADNLLQKTSRIDLSGTATLFDQSYFPDSIVRTYNAAAQAGGYSWTVSAKNHSPESEPTL